jgi:hypothetical protein
VDRECIALAKQNLLCIHFNHGACLLRLKRTGKLAALVRIHTRKAGLFEWKLVERPTEVEEGKARKQEGIQFSKPKLRQARPLKHPLLTMTSSIPL